MKYKFFTILARHPEAGEEALNQFCSQHRVSFVEKHLVTDGANSFWSVCVTWLEGEGTLLASQHKKPSVDYKQILNENEFVIFLELRNLRKQLAESQGVPPYALFTNEQLAAMVQQRINSKAALQAIPGVGQSRVEKYGEAFLQKLSELRAQDLAETDDEARPDQS
ncbi:MAG: HRDC domain-containing protein [Burkholderiales bacterium]|nr:HRDC domain-containing protein [Burkholderiales bacterium]